MVQVVFDYCAGTPWVPNDQIKEVMEQELQDGGPQTARDAMTDEEVRQLRTNEEYSSRYQEVYTTAGVNLASVTLSGSDPSLSYKENVYRDLSRWHAKFDAVDWLHKVTGIEDALEVAERDDVGVILNTQNLDAAIDGNIDGIEELYNHGVRIMQLTYNRQNSIGTGCTDRSDGGLSHFGQDAVEQVNDVGGVVDLSHCAKQTTLDAIEYSNKPVAFTHTSCQAIADHDRGKSDEEIKALADADGYMGIVALPFFLAPSRDDPSLEVFFNHLEHAVSILGIDRVGIGSDFSAHHDIDFPADRLHSEEALKEAGWREEHKLDRAMGFGEMKQYSDWYLIREGLEERYNDTEVEKVLGENFVDFWERSV